ncbi:HET-domain-containing protein, partial [Parathielavia hyrcaniae]
CNENHASCLSRTTTAPPARVIDVGDDHTGPCLRVTHEIGGIGLYLTLNYCWGEIPPPPPLPPNVADQCRGICLANLTRTFRDAVRIARAMRLRYLWIDSLCIVQDSPEDLTAETSRMDQIFQGAHLVLA